MAFQDNENDNEPVKLTEELRSEITEEEPIDSNVRVLEPTEPIVEPTEPVVELEDEERFEETTGTTDTTKVQERKPEREKTRKPNVGRNRPARVESVLISKLQNELAKHSDARKKTDLAVKDIQKQLKDLLLAHHATIKDLQKQVTQMHRKIATIDSYIKSSRSKATNKKTASSKKSKKKSSKKKSREH